MKRKINDFLNKFRDGDVPWGTSSLYVLFILFATCAYATSSEKNLMTVADFMFGLLVAGWALAFLLTK